MVFARSRRAELRAKHLPMTAVISGALSATGVRSLFRPAATSWDASPTLTSVSGASSTSMMFEPL